ncbi:MAG: hypothetical protein LQ350_003193 [Teloschistes chrysophthalmus]|nr:MAG: hypothetical protein LQ350_003193 [Niorma chrysophthalma]
MDSSRKKDVPPGPTLNKDTLSRSATSKSRTEHRTFYDDPVSVRQWAVQTDPNTSADLAGGFQSDDLSAVCAYPVSHELTRISRNPIGIDTHGIADPMKNYETWSYPTPTAEDMAYTTSTASYLPFSGGSSVEPRFADWPAGAFLSDEELPRSSAHFGSQSVAWSPVLATDPSVSSSYSQGSYLAMQPGTPLSPVAQEVDWPASHFASQEEETGMYPAFSLGEALSVPAACHFEQEDAMRLVYVRQNMTVADMQHSAVKPSRSSHPAPVTGADLWTQEDPHSYAYPGTSFVDLTYARRPSDGETNTTAREHPLYQVGPKEDGLYHCPFAGAEDCTHKPEKLKCNYEEHIANTLVNELILPRPNIIAATETEAIRLCQARDNEEDQVQQLSQGEHVSKQAAAFHAGRLATAKGVDQRSHGRLGPQ